MPILNQYHPGLIEQCRRAQDLSRDLVSSWLEKYMYAGRKDAKGMAEKSAGALADHGRFKSHSRHISKSMAAAPDLKLVVKSMEDDKKLHESVLSVFCAAVNTLPYGPVKIIESTKRAFMKLPPMPPFQATPPSAVRS